MEYMVSEYDDIIKYLSTFTNYERRADTKSEDYGLGRITKILELCHNPHMRFQSIHIAGTKGKGSVSTMTANILKEYGLNVGLYTSPHLVSIRERIVINGSMVSRDVFCEAFAKLKPALDFMSDSSEWQTPTYFEIITALGFIIFAEEAVDVAVVEVGLGGRLDATNVLKPKISVITPVSIDHVKQLGNTLESIAGEKGGIIKEFVPLIMGRQPEKVREVLDEIAESKNAKVYEYDQSNFKYKSSGSNYNKGVAEQNIDIYTGHNIFKNIKLPLLGEHQADNAALATGVASVFLEETQRDSLNIKVVKNAFKNTVMPGRIEVLSENPWVILDGAHNTASIWALCETLRERFADKGVIFILAFAKDKDISNMLKIITPVASEIILTEFSHERCLPAEDTAAILKGYDFKKYQVYKCPFSAIERAKKIAGKESVVCITGSLYLAGDIHKRLGDLED